jgi:hypothetical protein
MQTILDSGLLWWITVIDIPSMAALRALVLRTRADQDRHINNIRELLELRCNQLREALAASRLEAARSYASISEMKDLETRIISHLLRIEHKLDKTALKAEALEAHKTKPE